MAWTPSELLPFDLFPELLDGAVNFLVLFEVGTELRKLFVDILINPMSILQLDYEIQYINLGEMVLASLDLLQVIEEHQHDSCDFLLAMIIHHFGYFLDDGNRVVFKEFVSELMIAEDPQHAKNVIADLIRGKAFGVEKIRDHHEILLGRILLRQVVSFQNGQKGKAVCMDRQSEITWVILLNQIVEEFPSIL